MMEGKGVGPHSSGALMKLVLDIADDGRNPIFFPR